MQYDRLKFSLGYATVSDIRAIFTKGILILGNTKYYFNNRN